MSSCAGKETARAVVHVGIDFSTTFTGVTWTAPKLGVESIEVVKDWPGRTWGKVPTVLAEKGLENNRKWGFLCDELDEGSKWRFLKLCLHGKPEKLKESSWATNSRSETYNLVKEYLSQIYGHISGSIIEYLRRDVSWNGLAIDFIFSVPATWDGAIADNFLKIAREAGFGREARHNAALGLTEAAAAVVAASELDIPFTRGETILSIDAGGGTTDLALVTLKQAKPTQMVQNMAVVATGFGSVLIDMGFKQLVERQLTEHPGMPKNYAETLAQSQVFRDWKHAYGLPLQWNEFCRIYLPLVSNQPQNSESQGNRRWLEFHEKDLKTLFDGQLEGIKRCVDDTLVNFEEMGGNHVTHVVLSGGLGSSEYVFARMKEHLEQQKTERPCLRGVQLWKAATPELAVARGLVINKTNLLLKSGVAPASYGVVVEQPFCQNTHYGQQLTKNIHDGKFYAQNQIQWVIKKNTSLEPKTTFSHKIQRICSVSDSEEWTERIVFSDLNPGRLPGTMGAPGVKEIKSFAIRLGSTPTQLKKRLFSSRRYRVIMYELKFVVGHCGECRVDVCSNTGITLSEGMAKLSVSHLLPSGIILAPTRPDLKSF